VTPSAVDGASYRFLSDVIMARGLVTPSAMKAALQASLMGRSLTEILVDNGDLSEDDLARTLAEHHRLDHVDLDVFEIDREVSALIEPDVARRFGAIPIATLASGAVVVALYDPNGSTAGIEFARLIDRVIQPAVASRTQIEALIEELRHERHPAAPFAGMTRGDAHVPQSHLRSVPAGDTVFAAAPPPDAYASPAAPAAPAAPARGPGSPAAELESHLAAVRQRAETAERHRFEAEERARAAQELTRLADARTQAAQTRALAAEALVDAAQTRADKISSAAGETHDTLARLVHACEVLEREAQARAPELDGLRAALDDERRERARLQAQLHHTAPREQLVALQARIDELELQLREREAIARAGESTPVSAAPPAGPQPMPEAAERQAAEPQPAEPAGAEPQPEPQAAEPPAAEPQPAEPAGAEPQPEPQAAEPPAAEPQPAEPAGAEPQPEPQAAEPPAAETSDTVAAAPRATLRLVPADSRSTPSASSAPPARAHVAPRVRRRPGLLRALRHRG
jgi:hypothetical protein